MVEGDRSGADRSELHDPGSEALRRELSLPAVLLWRELRKRPAGLKFRRQHPAGPYVLDFYCDSARLAVEVDGQTHGHGDRPARDMARDSWLAERNVRTIRIAAAEVLEGVSAVVRHLVERARS